MLTEDTPPAPNTAYRRAKREAELRLAELREETGLRLVILRVPSVIGPGGRSWLDLFRAVGAGGFRIIGAGRNPIHPCPVEDVVSAMRLAGDSQGCEGETYIFSGRESMLLGAFLAAIGRAVGVPLSRVRLPAAPYRALLALRRAVDRAGGRAAELSAYEMFLSGYEIDNARARRDLGYEPTHSLEDSISATAAWYRAEGLL